MYRIGDTVRVKNGSDTCLYHNWPVGTEAVVQFVRENNLYLHVSPPRGDIMTNQTLYEHDVEFVSRSKYEEGDSVVVIGNNEVSHYLAINETVTIIGESWTERDITKVKVRGSIFCQTVSVKDIVPYDFWSANLSADIDSILEITTESQTAITTGYIAEAFEASRFAIAVENCKEEDEEVKCVRVQCFGDRPNGDDDSFTEFTSWLHPFIGGARDASSGLVIDACTVITFLGKIDQDDLFSIRYEDTGNIVIAKGKLNNGYAKYRA